jgi:AraC-like DNA-binding protein
MRPATLDELARAPVGRYVSGERWAHFCATASLWGVVLWGRPTEADAAGLGRSLVLELAPPAQAHASIVDASRLEGADAGAFAAAGRYLERHGEALGRVVRRLALVRPRGLVGAVVAGAYDVMRRPYPVAIFEDTAAALGWLAAEGEAVPPGLPEAIARIHETASSTPGLITSLRAELDARLSGISLARTARALGVSSRTLQRRLAESGTTFAAEVAAARLRAAERLLIDSDAPLTSIALDVGFSSLQHFSAMFRRHAGASPSSWRRRRRGTA